MSHYKRHAAELKFLITLHLLDIVDGKSYTMLSSAMIKKYLRIYTA